GAPPGPEEAGPDPAALVRGFDDELDRSQRREHTRFLQVGTYTLPLGVVIIHAVHCYSSLTIHIADTQRHGQCDSPIPISVRDFRIDGHKEGLPIHLSALGRDITEETAAKQQQSSPSHPLPHVGVRHPPRPPCLGSHLPPGSWLTPLCHTRPACDRASYGRSARGRPLRFSSPQSTPERAGYIRVRGPPRCTGA